MTLDFYFKVFLLKCNYTFKCGVILINNWLGLEWGLLARYIYTYEECVIVTEAPQYNRKTATGHKQQKNSVGLGLLACNYR